MNDLQKKFAVIGLIAFIVWFSMGYQHLSRVDDIASFTHYFISGNFIYGDANLAGAVFYGVSGADLFQTFFLGTGVGSLIAFFLFKD
ncbi:hypothetical protein HOI27_08855 [bacterium]|jgi:hypothetical protein|nr:hypothetical protein [Flavobacteriales bacterium]MBT4926761.1 hypothetical protein [bacterium]MBT5734897.1 hypothetical protein [bacterium]MDG2265710.1 hypothetical protein [Candidatus Neomarinimicrobiota bacterium]